MTSIDGPAEAVLLGAQSRVGKSIVAADMAALGADPVGGPVAMRLVVGDVGRGSGAGMSAAL